MASPYLPTKRNRSPIGLLLSRFLGFVNFYRSFLPNLSNTAKPLYNLIKTPGRITLNLLENQALLQIKSLVAKHILLTFPDFNRQFFIIADASDFGLGAVLCKPPSNPSTTPLRHFPLNSTS